MGVGKPQISESEPPRSYFIWRCFALVSIGLLVVATAYFYPALNWPDEGYKVEQVDTSDNLYFVAMRVFIEEGCSIIWGQDFRVGFGSNAFQFELTSGHGCYWELKTAHLAIFFVLMSILVVAMSHQNLWLLAVSLVLPMNIFLMAGINNQLVFHIAATVCGVMLIKGTQPFILLLWVLPLLPIDRTFVTLILFLGLVAGLRLSRRWSLVGFSLFFIVYKMEWIPFKDLAQVFIGIEDLGAVQKTLSRFDDGIVFSLAHFFGSLVYLGGTSTILGFGPEYVLAIGALLVGYWKMKERQDFHIYLFAFLGAYFLILEFTPTIQGYRYYVFVVPILIHYLLPKWRHQQILVIYSILMSMAYLIQGIALDIFQ